MQKAFVPQNFDAGTLLLRHMGWLLTQGPLTRRNLTQGGFWRSSLFAWHLTHFLCMAFDADWNRCHLTHFLCMAFDADWNRCHLTHFLCMAFDADWLYMSIDADLFPWQLTQNIFFLNFFFFKFFFKFLFYFFFFFFLATVKLGNSLLCKYILSQKSFWKLTFFQHFLGCSKSE